MVCGRPYLAARSKDELGRMMRCSGTQFDPEIVEIWPKL
jgi:response regulator RpfG family c-di-GMP phosphodiesterase